MARMTTRILTHVAVAVMVCGAVAGIILSFVYPSMALSWLAVSTGLVICTSLVFVLRADRKLVRSLLLIVSLVCVIAMIQFRKEAQDTRLRDRFLALPYGSIRSLSLHQEGGQSASITEAHVLSEFERAVKESRAYLPDHPVYTKTWYVTAWMEGSVTELEYHFERRLPYAVVFYFVEREGALTYYHGAMVSRLLRAWYERYIAIPEGLLGRQPPAE